MILDNYIILQNLGWKCYDAEMWETNFIVALAPFYLAN